MRRRSEEHMRRRELRRAEMTDEDWNEVARKKEQYLKDKFAKKDTPAYIAKARKIQKENEWQEWLKDGRIKLHNANATFTMFYYDVSAAVFTEDFRTVYYAFTICNTEDIYNSRVAKGILGHKLANAEYYSFEIDPRRLMEKSIVDLAFEHFCDNAKGILKNNIPSRLKK
jgi:hypothetical protein